MLVELMAPNPDGKLWAGTFAEVRFDVPGDAGVLRVPSSALIFRSHGAQLATVGDDGKRQAEGRRDRAQPRVRKSRSKAASSASDRDRHHTA